MNYDEFKETYELINRKFEKLQEEVASYKGVTIPYLYYTDFVDYAMNKLGIKFQNTSMPDELADKMSGMLIVANGKKKVVVNKKTHPNRQHFTLMHELSHALLHADLNKSQSFSDLLDDNSYSEDEQLDEAEANIGAGILMANDMALHHAIIDNYNFYNFARNVGMSSSALYFRTRQFLSANFGMNINGYDTIKLTNLCEKYGFGIILEKIGESYRGFFDRRMEERGEKFCDLTILEFNNPYFQRPSWLLQNMS
ncbi:M78 family (ImmA) [Fructobacillus evanidus]|uniref:M78 family (ImmA) n=1 Tax=Fructobacillus evanidus TaxID=3064281 RepID=A0ABN9Z085_9LACO|nr:M78 family (ImmA) [Fructobacillus sp. LMG 32999]CAK1255235.1 M78 family (ImmA) [Fructobacillus sp. LMG 32999]